MARAAPPVGRRKAGSEHGTVATPALASLAELRRFAISRSLFGPTTLKRAIERLGFVQADPIRAPARAQDLILMQRVKDYRAGDLERRYAELGIEEDFFVNYGFLAREFQALMHPRSGFEPFSRARARQAEQVLAFVRQQGSVHPREVEAHFGSGTETNYWGGSSNTTTRLLDSLHYRGFLRVARREAGVRVYAPARAALPPGIERVGLDELIDLAVRKYAPLPAASLSSLVSRLRYAGPQWTSEIKAGLARAKQRLSHAQAGGVEWYWPAGEELRKKGEEESDAQGTGGERLRLLSPFDPVVWDRRRFELFWGWPYRFEAYTPRLARKLGYYALPLLWRERALGWANLTFAENRLSATFGYADGKAPRDPAFRRALEAELARFEQFLSPRRSRSVTRTKSR
jgi:uncharacterized protein YcaQ